MPVKLRLQRHGKKGKPFYWIVAADARSKRDGKYLEKVGTYNPNSNPASVDLNVDAAVKWLQNGAQPTATAKNLLSQKGVLLKKHLLGGVAKGAITEAQAEEKFQAWIAEKEGAVNATKEELAKAAAAEKAKLIEAEKEVNAKREADAAAQLAEAEAAAKEAEVAAEATEETATNEEE